MKVSKREFQIFLGKQEGLKRDRSMIGDPPRTFYYRDDLDSSELCLFWEYYIDA